MRKDDILRLLKEADRPLSGEAMSHTLAVSRAAVWKAVETLREEGDPGRTPCPAAATG